LNGFRPSIATVDLKGDAAFVVFSDKHLAKLTKELREGAGRSASAGTFAAEKPDTSFRDAILDYMKYQKSGEDKSR
jgi:hypothetical protein